MPHIIKRVALIRDVIKNEQHSIKSGILYSLILTKRPKKGVVKSGQYFIKPRILEKNAPGHKGVRGTNIEDFSHGWIFLDDFLRTKPTINC